MQTAITLGNRVWAGVRRLFGRGGPDATSGLSGGAFLGELSNRAYFDLLKRYYISNALYDELVRGLRVWGAPSETLKALRNPAFRVVEFYAALLWGQGELQVITSNARIVGLISKIRKWSNWDTQRQVFARWLGNYGNVFIKVAESEDQERVFHQNIEPQNVSAFKADERGFLTFIRIDLAVEPDQTKQPNGAVSSEWRTYTEVWDKAAGTMRIWKAHTHGDSAALDELDKPNTLQQIVDLVGSNFIPIVHAKLRDIGEPRGAGAFVMALDKINEANLLATRLHQMLFVNNRNVWALKANAQTQDGRPYPPVKVDFDKDEKTNERDAGTRAELVTDKMIRLPGFTELQSLVPNLRYAEMLAILNAQLEEIKDDLPELAWADIRKMPNPSGVAVGLMLLDAVGRLLEARSNAEAALARADEMALTIGKHAGIDGFADIGTFEAGDFAHAFAKRAVIAVGEKERADTIKVEVDAGIPLETAERRNGWSEDELAQQLKDEQAAQQRGIDHAKAMLNATQPTLPPPNQQPPQLQRADAGN